MARGSESTADLYVRLGLSYDELESGFVNAERTIRDNMTRLSRENQIIDLQARVEIAGLDETADAEQILQIRTRALNQQLEHQRDRVRLASAELANMTDRTGENSDQTQRARLALERERLALVQLEEQLASLNDSQDDTGDSTDGLRERFSALAGKLAPVAAGFTAVIGAMTAAGEATKALIEDWRELQQQSYELNMSISDTRKLLRQIRLAGGDIGDFEGYIRGITDAYVKGEKDDPEFIALGRYGAKITDATGKLKDFKSITEEVYQAYLKAKAAGEEIEFLQMTGGESGVRDAIQLFERYAEAKEDAAKIVDAGLDQKQMHAAERSLNLLMEQVKEFKDAAVNVITPATVKAIDDLFGIFNAGTKAIKENTDTLRDWGSAIAEIASFMPGVHEFGWTWDAIKALANVESEAEKTAENIKKANDKTQEGVASWADYRKATEGATKSWGDFRRETDPKRGEDPLNQYGWQRLRDLKNEIEDIRVEIKNFNNDYKQSLAELGLEKDRALDSPNYLSLKEELAIRERYTAQLELLEKKRAEAIKEAREDVEAELGTDLDQQLLDFQRRKKDWISAGMDAAEAEVLAEKLKIDAIEELEKEFNAERDALRNTNLQNQLDAIEKEKEAWIDKGVSEAEAEELAQLRIAKVREEYLQKAQDLLQEAADIEYHSTHNALENQLYDVERWKQAQLEKAETAEEVAATIADAAAKEAEAFEREMDRIQGRVESGQDRLARLALSQRDYDLYKAFKDYQQDLKQYPKALADAIYNLTQHQIQQRASNDKSGNYTKGTGFDVSALINADPRKIAAMEMLKNYGVGTEELKKALGNTATAQEAYKNILQRVTAGMSADSGKLGSAFTGVAKGVSSLGDAAGESADKITAAADTIKLALEMVAGIEEENARREEARNADDGRIPIIYGDEDYSSYTDNNGIEILYGDLEDFGNSLGDLSKSTADMIRDYMVEMDSAPITEFQQGINQATDSVNKSVGASENLADAAQNAGTSTNAFSDELNKTADALDALREKIANTPIQPLPQEQPQQTPQYDNFSDVFDKALKGTATFGELTALGGLATLQPEIALLGAGIEALANTAQTLRELAKEPPPSQSQPQSSSAAQPDSPTTSVDLSAIQQTLSEISQTLNTVAQAPPVDLTPLQEALQQLSTEATPALSEINTSIQGMSTELSTKLAEIAQSISSMAQSVSASQNRQPPQVNVTVNPNINLGGAYVFDNAMKQQLTNDIATEVINAVTSAVQTATQQANYGYGN